MKDMDQHTLARVRAEAKVAARHMGITAYADLLGVTVPKMKELQQEAGSTQVVRWSQLSTPVLRSVFDAYIEGREVASRFCSRHRYSVGGFSQTMRDMWPEEWAMATEDKKPHAANYYRMGRDLEGRTRLKLMAAGYAVIRSAGSKTPADLVAMRNGELLLVQCKRGGALPPVEWNDLIDFATQAGGRPIMVENPHAGTVRWWELETRKLGRGTGTKRQLDAPQALANINLIDLTRRLRNAEQDEAEAGEEEFSRAAHN